MPTLANTTPATSTAPPVALALSAEDDQHLAAFEQTLDLLRDRARGVAEDYQCGCYVVGRPGSSKTHTIMEELKRLDAPSTYRNARLTAAGLFELLQEHPEHTIVLDDIPSVVRDKLAMPILMAALAGTPGTPRPLTYTLKNERQSFDFCGGIIAISNVPLRRDPLADALQSRMPMLAHEPTDEMLSAFMRSRAASGFADLTPQECRQVVEFVIAESRSADYRLDLRMMTKAWQDYRQHKDGKARRPWQDLIRSGLKQIVVSTYNRVSGDGCREANRQRELEIAADLFRRLPGPKNKADRDLAWQETTGKSVDTLYRRRRQQKVEDVA